MTVSQNFQGSSAGKASGDSCETCLYYEYDEEYDCDTCLMDLDEDEMRLFLIGHTRSCPYYKFGDEYSVVKHQI